VVTTELAAAVALGKLAVTVLAQTEMVETESLLPLQDLALPTLAAVAVEEPTTLAVRLLEELAVAVTATLLVIPVATEQTIPAVAVEQVGLLPLAVHTWEMVETVVLEL
jgi:hypothetical protein